MCVCCECGRYLCVLYTAFRVVDGLLAMYDVVRVDSSVDVDLSLASAYLPICVVVAKTLLLVAVLYVGSALRLSCVFVLGFLYVATGVDSVLTCERVMNTNVLMVYVVHALLVSLVSDVVCGVPVLCATLSVLVLMCMLVCLLIVSLQIRVRAVSIAFCRVVFKCVGVVVYGVLFTVRCAFGSYVGELRVDVVHECVARCVVYVAVVVVWVYVVDVRKPDHRLRAGLDAHVFFYFVMVLAWVYVVVGVLCVLVVVCVCVLRSNPRAVDGLPVAKSVLDSSPQRVESAVCTGASEEDLELLRRAKAQRHA